MAFKRDIVIGPGEKPDTTVSGGIGKPATYMIGDLTTMDFTERFVQTDNLVIQNTDPVTPHTS